MTNRIQYQEEMVMKNPYEHTDCIPWYFHFSTEFIFEISTAEVERLLPAGIFPKEVRPGVSCLGIGVTDFVEGNAGYIPAFTELTASVLVSPNFSKTNEVPSFAAYILAVTGTTNEFLEFTSTHDKVPTYNPHNLKVEINNDRFATKAEDDNGPIMDIHNIHPSPTFEKDRVPFQVITTCEEKMFLTNIDITVEKFEHQQKGNPGNLFNHPLFCGLQVEQCTQCYMQYLSAPVCNGVMNWHKPIRIR